MGLNGREERTDALKRINRLTAEIVATCIINYITSEEGNIMVLKRRFTSMKEHLITIFKEAIYTLIRATRILKHLCLTDAGWTTILN